MDFYKFFGHRVPWMEFNAFFELLNSTLFGIAQLEIRDAGFCLYFILEVPGSDLCHLGK